MIGKEDMLRAARRMAETGYSHMELQTFALTLLDLSLVTRETVVEMDAAFRAAFKGHAPEGDESEART